MSDDTSDATSDGNAAPRREPQEQVLRTTFRGRQVTIAARMDPPHDAWVQRVEIDGDAWDDPVAERFYSLDLAISAGLIFAADRMIGSDEAPAEEHPPGTAG